MMVLSDAAQAKALPDRLLLVLNCGSSSIKYAIYQVPTHAAANALPRQARWRGKVQDIGGPHPRLEVSGSPPQPLTLRAPHPYRDALTLLIQHIQQRLAGRSLDGVAHRIVHGGSKYFGPVLMTPVVLSDLRRYIPLAPLHQPFALDAIDILLKDHPTLRQAACFDTAFHQSLPLLEQLLPLPYEAWEQGLRRYGFHGLSYQYLSIVLKEKYPDQASARVLAAHLGSGASLCALQDGKSVATTMGFSALDGLMMGTRCGTLDPGALLYLMEIEKLSVDEVGRLLYHQSGLLGVSGLSPDPPTLQQHASAPGPAGERARLALALYVRRIVKEIGALVAVLGGLDMLVFTAGVGEHNAGIRQHICQQLSFLGVALDDAANLAHAAVISSPASRVKVVVEPTQEEWMVAELVRHWF